MVEELAIIDGFFEISQNMRTREIILKEYGQPVRSIAGGPVLNMDELHALLIRERTRYFVEGSGE